MYWAEYQGIYFVEGPVKGAAPIEPISTTHDGWFSQSQLKSLDTIKTAMVDRVRVAGGNAVIDFTYGQKNTFWRSLFSIDEVYWSATGTIATIDVAALPAR